MALDSDILEVAGAPQATSQAGGLDPDIIASVAPPAAQDAQGAPPTGLQKVGSEITRALGRLPAVTPLQQLLKIPAVRQFEEAGLKQGVAVPAESLARLIGFKGVPITPPDISTTAGKLGALGGGAAGFGLTAAGGGEALEAPAIASTLESLGMLGKGIQAAAPLAAQAGFGAAESPGARLRGAALGTLGGVAGKSVGQLAPEAGNIRDFLLGGTAPEEIPKVASNAVDNAYGKVKDVSRRLYGKVQDLADKAKFKLPYNDLQFTSSAIQKAEDDFNLQPSTQKSLDKLTDLITSPTKKIADYGEIHNQIMDLGEKSSSAYKPGTFEDSQALRSVKHALMDDVRNKAQNMGASEVTNALDDANSHYRLNVAPYHDKGVFGGIIKKTVPPDQIANILTKSDNAKVLDDLSPQVKNLLLHEKLKSAMQLTPRGKIEADPQKLWNAFSNLRAKNPALAERLITDEAHNRILPLGQSLQSALRAIPGVRKISEIARKLPVIRGVAKTPLARNALQGLLQSGAVQAPSLLEGGQQ